MKNPKEVLNSKYRFSVKAVILSLLGLIVAVFMMLPGFSYGENYEPWWSVTLRVIAAIPFLLGILGIIEGVPLWLRYLGLKLSARCYTASFVVEDKFRLVESVGGGSGVNDIYYLAGSQGSLRLDEELAEVYKTVQPGAIVRGAIIAGRSVKELVDVEIQEAGVTPESLPEDAITDKIASQVNIKGYEDGEYIYNKLFLIQTLKYYLIVNNKPYKVDRHVFINSKLYSRYTHTES